MDSDRSATPALVILPAPQRLWRSTRVPIAVIFFPKMRSPSQWPGTARSATSAGRSEIITMSASWPWPTPPLV